MHVPSKKVIRVFQSGSVLPNPVNALQATSDAASQSSQQTIVDERPANPGTPDSPRPQDESAPRAALNSEAGSDEPLPMMDASLATLALSLLSAIGEGVGLATRSGRIIWDNAMLAGLSSAMRERISTQCRQFEKDHPLTPKGVKVPKGWLPPRTEQVLAEDDRFFELVVTPVSRATLDAIGPDVESWAECLVLVVRDVTAARRLQHRINAIDQAGSELLKFDTELMRKLNAVERLKHLEDKIVRFCRDLLHFDHFAIRLLDKATGKLELVIGCGLPSDYDSFAIKPALEGNGITGYVAASGRS